MDKGFFWVERGHGPVRGQFIVEATKEGFQAASITVEAGEIRRGVRMVLVRQGPKPGATPDKGSLDGPNDAREPRHLLD